MGESGVTDSKVGTTTITITPPGEPEPVEIELDLMGFTLAERNLAKKAVAQLTDPDLIEIVAVNAWVVWRRTHPDVKIGDWFDGITFGDMLGITDLGELLDQPLETPEDFDPEA